VRAAGTVSGRSAGGRATRGGGRASARSPERSERLRAIRCLMTRRPSAPALCFP